LDLIAVTRDQIRSYGSGVVWRSVVDNDDLPIRERLGDDASHGFGEVLRLVEAGDDHRYCWIRIAHPKSA
jgi:hypothetical protein